MGAEGPKTVDTQAERVEDKAALESKVNKFEAFIASEAHNALPAAEQQRVEAQLHHMKSYLATLGERIAAVL